MTNGEKFLVGCSIVFVTAALFGIAGCGMFFYRSATNFPEYAKIENVSYDHRDIILQVEKIIASSVSFPEMQQKLMSVNWPDKVLYLKLAEDETSIKAQKRPTQAQSAEIIKRVQWNGHSTFLKNGSGYGHLNAPKGKVKIIIIDQQQTAGNASTMNYLLYLSAPDTEK